MAPQACRAPWNLGRTFILKRSLARLRHDQALVVVVEAPERLRVGPSKRESFQTPHARTLAPELEAKLTRLAPGRSLRPPATQLGISHETVRKILCDQEGILDR